EFKVEAADPSSHGSDLASVGKSAQVDSLGDNQHSKFQILRADSTYGLRFESGVTISPLESGHGKINMDCLGIERNTKLPIVGDDSVHSLDSKISTGFLLDGQRLDAKSNSKHQYAHVSNQMKNRDLHVVNDALSLNFVANGKTNSSVKSNVTGGVGNLVAINPYAYVGLLLSSGSNFEDIRHAGNGLSFDKSLSRIGTVARLHVNKSFARKNMGLSFADVVGNIK
ncbi:hypothetical protein PanWU01x14_319170, partial [Parasponia andersonii]